MSAEVVEQALVYDSPEPIEVPVTIGKKSYALCEAPEDAAAKYQNFSAKQIKYTPEGKVAGVGDVADSRAMLVSLCLFEVVEGGGRAPVSIQAVRKMKSRIVKELFETAKRISDIDQETEEIIEKRIAADQARLKELRAAKKNGAEGVEGNSPGDGTATSASPTS